MRTLLKSISSNLLAFLLVFEAVSSTAREIPRHTGFVVDEAGLLSAGESDRLESALRRFHASAGPQLQVLITPSLEGDALESFSMRVVDQWKLGDEKRDDGILLLLALKEREVRIEVGQGLEGQIPDIVAGRIIRESMTPYFRAGQLAEGIEAGLVAIAGALGQPIDLKASSLSNKSHAGRRSIRLSPLQSAILAFLLFGIFMILPRIHAAQQRGLRSRHRGGGWGGFGGGGSGGWSGGGFGGSFGGGGGGGFSGGGASGRW